MAQNKRTVPKYVYDIPYFERMELCRILDQNDKWEELGGIYMNFDMLTIQSLRREILRGNSPTDELLTKWGHQNHTILELFVLLSKMQHYQAMLVIKQFVDAEYHKLIYEGEQNFNRLFATKHSNINVTNVLNQSDLQLPCVSHRCTNPNEQNINKEDYGNHHSKALSNIPENYSPIRNHTSERGNTVEKIINIHDSSLENSKVEKKVLNRSNAQTILINRPVNDVPNPLEEHQMALGFLKPLSAKDKNVSEISSIAESVGILPMITFKELELATNGWDQSSILGKGGFGTVYKGTWKNTSVAIKRTRDSDADENHSVQIQQILGELKMLNSYRHDNILPLYGFSMDGENPCLIYQYMPNGSLEDRLLCRHNTKPLSWHQRLNIATGTARGIQFLHTIGEKPLIHGDIKSANILLDLNYEPKIGDFGLAREGPYNHYTHMKVSRVHGTRPYLPDEFLRHKKFSTKVDTHSFGIVLFELATGLRAYDDQRLHKFLKDLIENTNINNLGTLMDRKSGLDEQQIFSNLITLGKCCVSRKPKDRPEMVIVLQELNAMSIKRDMIVKAQSMLRQNSLTPTSPFEMQIFHDYLSQQKRNFPISSNAINNINPTRAVSPMQPPSSPESDMSKTDKNNFDAKDGGSSNAEGTKQNDCTIVAETVSAVKSIEVQAQNLKQGNIVNSPQLLLGKTPIISVSPPSGIYSSSNDDEDEDEEDDNDTEGAEATVVETNTEPEVDYELNSDIESFLPLISVLGVKTKSKQKEVKDNDQVANVRIVDVNTSAKGKPLWILSDSNIQNQQKKILEELNLRKQLLKSGTAQTLNPSSLNSPIGVSVIASNTSDSQMSNFSRAAHSNSLLQHANNTSFGYFIPQESLFGNNILAVFPRFNENK